VRKKIFFKAFFQVFRKEVIQMADDIAKVVANTVVVTNTKVANQDATDDPEAILKLMGIR